MSAGPRPNKDAYESVSLVTATTTIATSTGTAETRLPYAPAFGFMLDVTAAATETADTLDVYVQTLVGEKWVDIVHFTQVLGDGGAKRYFSKVAAALATSEFENGGTFNGGSVRNLLGDSYRCRWDLTDSATDNASFTFSVVAIPMGV